jgi:hypothetical protein
MGKELGIGLLRFEAMPNIYELPYSKYQIDICFKNVQKFGGNYLCNGIFTSNTLRLLLAVGLDILYL